MPLFFLLYPVIVIVPGQAILCDGVCQWWRPDVPDTTMWKVQGTSCCVSKFSVYLLVLSHFKTLGKTSKKKRVKLVTSGKKVG